MLKLIRVSPSNKKLALRKKAEINNCRGYFYLVGKNKCKQKGIENIHVITCDMNDFDTDKKFDRVVSIEMFEHMRN